MSDQSGGAPAGEPTEPTRQASPAVASSQTEPNQTNGADSRWSRLRPRGRLNQVAAALVAVAAALFIVGAIFVAGFAAGAESGWHGEQYGEHHSHSEGSDRSEASDGGKSSDRGGRSDEKVGQGQDSDRSGGREGGG